MKNLTGLMIGIMFLMIPSSVFAQSTIFVPFVTSMQETVETSISEVRPEIELGGEEDYSSVPPSNLEQRLIDYIVAHPNLSMSASLENFKQENAEEIQAIAEQYSKNLANTSSEQDATTTPLSNYRKYRISEIKDITFADPFFVILNEESETNDVAIRAATRGSWTPIKQSTYTVNPWWTAATVSVYIKGQCEYNVAGGPKANITDKGYDLNSSAFDLSWWLVSNSSFGTAHFYESGQKWERMYYSAEVEFADVLPGRFNPHSYRVQVSANLRCNNHGAIYPYSVTPKHVKQYFHQNVFQENGECRAYRASMNNLGRLNPWDYEGPCDTYAPGSGKVTSYTNWVAGDHLHEALWRGGRGYVRKVPLNTNGTVGWNRAPNWQHCCTGVSVGGQGAYTLGEYFYQTVYAKDGTCTEYKSTLNGDGTIKLPWLSSGPCKNAQRAPGRGDVTSYTNWIAGGLFQEALWRGNKGYIRATIINPRTNTVDWNRVGDWRQCCSNSKVGGQGAYILNY